MDLRRTESGRHRPRRTLILATVATVATVVAAGFAVIAPASAAGAATSVSAVTVDVSSPTAAAGALTTYNVAFKTSASGALSGSADDTITVVMPAGTGLTNLSGASVTVGATQDGFCSQKSGTTATCFLYSGMTIAANTTVALALNGIDNPTTVGSAYKLTVSTSSDTAAVTSPAYSVVAAHPLSTVTVDVSAPTPAAGALTTYTVGFKTSATGGLSGDTGSTITVVMPAGTGLTNLSGAGVEVGTTQDGFCSLKSGTTAVCVLYVGDAIAANTTVTLDLNGIDNPTTVGSAYKLTVSTSSDPATITSPTYSVVAGHPLAALTVDESAPTTAAGGLTTYTVGFKTSATGGLSGDTGSTITVVMPAGTVLKNLSGAGIKVGTTQDGFCALKGGTTVTCFVYTGYKIAANTTVTLDLNGVNNPAAVGSAYKLTVATSSDTATITSPTYTVTAAKALTGLTVVPSSILPGATSVTYKATLKPSPTGALAGDTGSTVTLVLPAGTGLSAVSASNPMKVGATQVGFCAVDSGETVLCHLYGGDTVAPGATLVITLTGVTNPTTAGPYSTRVSTSSDTKAKSSSYCIVTAGVPCISDVSPATGPYGAAVTITGVNLGAATKVAFHDKVATIITDTATKITTTVPTGATTGTVTVTTSAGTATSALSFKVIKPPTITTFSPSSGAVGASVTISGTNLAKASSVKFNGKVAIVTGDTAAAITTTVPTGATTGKIVVVTPGGTATSTANFTVT